MIFQFIESHPSILIIAITYLIIGLIFLYWKKVSDNEEFDELPDGEIILNPTFVGNSDNNENRSVSTVHSYDLRRNNEIRNSSSNISNPGRYTVRAPDEVDYASTEYLKLNRDRKNYNRESVQYANVKNIPLRSSVRNKVKHKPGPLDFKENGMDVQHSSGAYLHMDDFDDFDVLSIKENVMRIAVNIDGDATTSNLNSSIN